MRRDASWSDDTGSRVSAWVSFGFSGEARERSREKLR